MTRFQRVFLVAVVPAVGACFGVDRGYHGGMRACLVTEGTTLVPGDTGLSGAALSLEDGDTATVEVLVSSCASSSTRWRRLSCSAVLEGDVLTLDSDARSRTPRVATADCMVVSVTCETPPLPAGSLTVRYFGDQTTVDVPYDGGPVCLVPAFP